MNEFEPSLRRALRRRQPPPDFADRVLARVRVRKSEEGRHRRPRWVAACAAAAAIIALVGGGAVYRENWQRARDERAKEQLLYALRVTGSQVRYLQARLAEAQQRSIELPLRVPLNDQ